MSDLISFNILSASTFIHCMTAGIETYDKLCSYSIEELKTIHKFPKKCIFELQEILHRKDLKFKNEDEELDPVRKLHSELEARISSLNIEMKYLFRTLEKAHCVLGKLEKNKKAK